MMISSGGFFISKFWVFGKRAKNGLKWQKILSVALHISGIIHNMIVISGTLVWNDGISRRFFHSFNILIFWVVGRGKMAKMVHDEKKLYLSHSISQEPYIIWFSFKVHMCKMIISIGFFVIFSKFWFFSLSRGWGKRVKNSPKWQKIMSVVLHI